MRTDIQALSAFLHAAQQGSFAAAAASLNISPAAVGQSIKRLEAHYGIKLFTRTTRSISLTPAGELLRQQAQGPVEAIRALDEVFATQRGEVSGKVRLSAPLFFSKHYLLPVIAELGERYPLLAFDLDASDQKRDFVRDPVDLVIRMDQPTDSNLIARPIRTVRTMTFASHAYLAKYGTPQTPQDLKDHRCIAYRFPSSGVKYHWQFAQHGHISSFDPGETLVCNDPEMSCEAATAGMGILQTADIIARPYLKDHEVQPVLQAYALDGRTLYLCYPSREHNPLRISVTVAALMARFAPLANGLEV